MRGKTTHGHTSGGPSKTYVAWRAMRARCNNKNLRQYKDYGGRGISVDPRWEKFENFLADMGESPPGLSLDRIDNNGNYCKENCRWATRIQQQNNRRTNKHIEHNGRMLTLTEYSRETGKTFGTERKAETRQRWRDAGLVPKEVWVLPTQWERLKAFIRRLNKAK